MNYTVRILILYVTISVVGFPASAAQPDIDKRLALELEHATREERELYADIHLISQKSQPEFKGIVAEVTPSVISSCFTAPLPTSPGQGSQSFTHTRYDGSRKTLTFWREPCTSDATQSAVLVKITPSGGPFVCSGHFDVVQSSYQYDTVKLVQQLGGSSFCGDLHVTTTFILDQWRHEDPKFNDQEAFTIFYDDTDPSTQIAISANNYKPLPPSSDVVLKIEEPSIGSVYSGVSTVRGYALADSGITRVELYINGKYKGDLPYGGKRGDIGNAFPEVPNSDKSGFAAAFNYNNLGAGEHTFTARAIASDSSSKEYSSTFTVTNFHKNYFSDPNSINASNSDLSASGNDIFINNLLVDGILYKVKLKWRKQSQGFEIVEIE